jgi:ubiquitin-conjugating enzyme E2 O
LLFYGDDIARLRLVRGKTDAIMRIGDRVVLKDTTAGPVTRHGSTGDAFGIIEVRLCRVKVCIPAYL